MHKRVFMLLLVAMVLLSVAVSVLAEKDKDTIVCPVCGFIMPKSEASIYEHEGKAHYFCDPGCKAYFIANPEQLASGKTFDAVCGMVIDKDKAVTATHNGFEVYFCSAQCKEKYFADPAKFEINYDVVASEVKPVREMKHTTEFEGRTFYFISEENKKKFEENPDAYVWAECTIGGDVFLRKDAYAEREYKGKTYYFGCKGCLEAFEKDPEKFLDPAYMMDHKCQHAGVHQGCPLKKASTEKDCPNKDKHKDCPHNKKTEKVKTKKS